MPHAYQNFAESGFAWVDAKARHELAVVFVHGWWGDCQTTWTWNPSYPARLKWWSRQPDVSLLDLLRSDGQLLCDYHSVAHSAAPFSSTLIETIASSLRTSLEQISEDKYIILVAHSLGGVVCRRAIIEALNGELPVVQRILGLLMFGTPNNGTELAWAAGSFLKSLSAKQLRPLDNWLSSLNTGWLEHVINGGNPRQDLKRRLALRILSVVGERDRIVPPGSAAALSQIGQVAVIHKTHRSLPKANNAQDRSYVILKQFLMDCIKDLAMRPLLEGTVLLQNRIRLAMSQRNDWCREEREYITVQKPSSSPVSEASLTTSVVNCKLHGVRIGYPIKPDFLVGIRLADRPIGYQKLDYDYILGRGLMEKEEYKGLVERLDQASANKEGLDKLVKVISLNVKNIRTDEIIDYSFYQLDSGPGYAVMTFKAVKSGVEEIGRHSRLEFKFQTTMRLEHGWYKYYCARPIINKLHVELTAPWQLIPIPCCDRSYAEIDEVPGAGENTTSVVEIDGPIPEGSFITWLFATEA